MAGYTRQEREFNFWKSLLVLTLLIGVASGAVAVYFGLRHEVVIVDGRSRKFTTFRSTVGEVLGEAGVKLGRYDRVVPGLAARVDDGVRIEVIRAFPVEVIADGQTRIVWTTPAKVREVLRLAGIKPGRHDRVEPGLNDQVRARDRIRVVRVSFLYQSRHRTVPFQTEQRPDNRMYRGFKRVAREGREGLEKIVYRVTLEDGIPVKREVVARQTVQRPLNRIVALGTIRYVSRGGSTIRFSRAIRVAATAYTHTGHRTATGTVPGRGVVAVDPAVIPMGTRVYIEGYGLAVARDVGSGIRGYEVDLFMETEAEARWWGRRNVTLYILE